MLGGPVGRRVEIGAGQILVLPAGTGHCNLGARDDFLIVGAYADGLPWDLRRGDPGEREDALSKIREFPTPGADPVYGPTGSLLELWGTPG
jgi:uncharacterized protein YjlB